MNIQKIYDTYRIPNHLQQHMKDVAAVSHAIVELWEGPQIDKEEIVSACLLHDMGNVVKFRFDHMEHFPEQKKIADELQELKDQFIKSYGDDDHEVTLKICSELKVSARIYWLIENKEFKSLPQTITSNDYSLKIVGYADNRVGPNGIISLDDRIHDIKKRYSDNSQSLVSTPDRDYYFNLCYELERQINPFTSNSLNEITKEARTVYGTKLEFWEVSTE
ncbi:hypothetical protein KC717_02735 [Candidatus Dojkabacteria bacterium]|uniref:HD domain-containing protein n=1 Tax=Candidatus Dojkabacteria bacterium TaxID=2099670 RepID=A0A955RK58_9BACT|nr:hypothetical protein [Candidatus Dojkabacteria bacterium]